MTTTTRKGADPRAGVPSPLNTMLSHGFAVGPLSGKLPLTKHGVQDFSRDTDVIARWAKQFPSCNWGVTQPGVVALDVDPRHGGRVKALRLRPEHRTLSVQTGSGGWHFYYSVSGPVRGKVQGIDGIDVKSGGTGYLVAPGSIHPDTGMPYTLHRDAPIATVPEHLWGLIERPTHTSLRTPIRAAGDQWDGLVRAVQDAQPGNRNGTLFWAAARAAADHAPASVFSALAEAAHQTGLGTHEIQQTIQSGQRKATA